MLEMIFKLSLLMLIVVGEFQEKCHAEQYLFLVGVRDYSQNGIFIDLRFPEDDVHSLAQLFSDIGVPSSNIVLMTQRVASTNARFSPRAELIEKELKLLLETLRPEDSIIIGFSGHGLQFKDEDYSTHYFCPTDADPEQKETLVSLSEVYRMLTQTKASTKLLLVDVPRTVSLDTASRDTVRKSKVIEIESVTPGALTSSFDTAPQDTMRKSKVIEIKPVPLDEERKLVDDVTIAIFSCSDSESTYESDELKSRVFFHFLNRAFSGEADIDDDNTIDAFELEKFVSRNVEEFTRKVLGVSQTPESLGTRRGLMRIPHLKRKVVPKPSPIRMPR
jgi:hypothetical protein